LRSAKLCWDGSVKKEHLENMPKELIVSVNGREKKIAIIENERVTEFYIERGEDNQGIVGNIYKGRVMRVLPGMQSAFVDIGLERDAFLYVSDFFDEEEEFERIVMDKSKKGDTASAEKAAKEQIEQARIEREHRIESTQERAEPLLDLAAPSVTAEAETPVEAIEVAEPPAQISTTRQARDSESGRRRGRRGRRRGRDGEETHEPQTTLVPTVEQEAEAEGVGTPFAVAVEDFHRIVDEDEIAAEDGSMFKDARVQEKIFDQIHAVEFDLDDIAAAPVGSLISAGLGTTGGSFERIVDSEESVESREDVAMVHPAVEAHIQAFIDDVTQEASGSVNFERINDEEQAAAEVGLPNDAPEEKPTKRARPRRSRKAETEEGDTAVETAGAEGAEPEPKAKRGRSAKAGSRKSASKGSARSKRSDAAEGARETKSAATEETQSNEAGPDAGEETYGDAEASISSGRDRAEFATRRGGRRRRRPGPGKHEGPGGDGVDHSNGKDDEAGSQPEVAEASAPAAIPSPAHSSAQTKERHHNGGYRGAPRRERTQPAITDLLREGQEILVQIAKEPIAKKGARITSHIALPGRFLVYMPTVEHVGVSRKIESDSERQRLRKLIQAIRAEENVPSGGFIVRTAGVGISEADLRDDARYLVRTWLDIRRNAEKSKAAALVHQDLDLVQRLLRDQLSDDFTAIRVDSEEEYLQIVEFINRIQPRMVNRVKLYTREEPILEAYGVQGEVDKAIKPRVWLKSGGYLVINQTEALVAIDVNTGKFVGRGGTRLEDTITKTNLEAVEEIVRQIRLRDLGGIIVLDLIDMEDRRNRNRVMQALQEALQHDKSPTKVLSFNDFGLVIMTRKRVKQSLERTLCSPCPYCTGAGLVKSPQTVCYEILEEARRLSRAMDQNGIKQTTLRVNPEIGKALRASERDVLIEIEDYLGPIDLTSDSHVHQEQFDFAFI
jgi:ribonuclease G